MQIRAAVRLRLTPLRMAVTHETSHSSAGQAMGPRTPQMLLVGMRVGAAATENSVEGPQNETRTTAAQQSLFSVATRKF